MSRADLCRALSTGALALLCSPPPMHAQQTTEATLLGRIDSLRPLLEAAEVEADLARARRAEAERRANVTVTDTLSVGPLTIVTVPENRDAAARLFRRVWENDFASFVGTSPSLSDQWFTFQWAMELRPILVEGRAPQRVELVRWRPTRPTEVIRQSIINALADDLTGTQILAWANAVRTPVRPEELYRQLALSPSRASRACLAGNARSCWVGMGLDPGADSYPLDDWYSPEERRALVGRLYWSRTLQSLRDDCTETGTLRSCDVLLADRLTTLGNPSELAPLRPPARAALLWIALQKGGAGAWDRLRGDPQATPAQALLSASGLTAEELSSAWLEHVQANRPASKAGTGLSLMMALFWFAGFGTLALRSTRWR
jgi:hypothetical protein